MHEIFFSRLVQMTKLYIEFIVLSSDLRRMWVREPQSIFVFRLWIRDLVSEPVVVSYACSYEEEHKNCSEILYSYRYNPVVNEFYL